MRPVLYLCVFLMSCSSSRISGVYHRRDETLNLKADSTYEYEFRIERLLSSSKGKWSFVSDNEISLTSTLDLENLPIKVQEHKTESNVSTFIVHSSYDSIVLNKNNIEYGLVLDGVERIRQRGNEIKHPLANIKSFKINIYYVFNQLPVTQVNREMISTSVYQVLNPNSNVFDISVDPLTVEMFNSTTFHNSKLIHKGNKIFWEAKGKVPFKKVN